MNTNKLSFLAFIAIGFVMTLTASEHTFDQGMKTPERKRPVGRYYESPITPPNFKRPCPSSVEKDKNFEKCKNCATAKSWHEPAVLLINRKTVNCWPQLWNANKNDDTYIKRLAALALKDGTTLLHLAACENNIACMTDLIRYGEADLTAKKIKCKSAPLHEWAMDIFCCAEPQAQQVSAAILDSLRRTKSSFPDKSFLGNDQGSSPLHVVCSKNLRNPHIFKALLDAGHPLDVYNMSGQSFLHYLASNDGGSQENLKAILTALESHVLSAGLLNKRSNVPFEQTALHIAVEQKNVLMVDFLVTRPGINLNVKDHIGQTPLHVAACLLNYQPNDQAALYIYQKLISSGADQAIADDDGQTAEQQRTKKIS